MKTVGLALKFLVCAALFAGGMANGARAQEVMRVAWPTRHAALAAESPEVAPFLPMLRASVDRLPESAVVNLALARSSLFGVSSSEAEQLKVLVDRRYARIAADPVFRNVSSTLAYCLSEDRPGQGLALVYRPRGATDGATPVLLFVHGYGGGFLWHLHQLAEWFPDHLILAPAHGVDPSAIPSAYLEECIRASATRLGHSLAKPALIGFSAGGFGVTRAYAANPARYAQLVVMAAYPPDESFRAWPRTARAAFVVGEREDYVADGGFATYARSLAARSARFNGTIIPRAGAFFWLTHPVETRKALQVSLSSQDR